MLFTPEKFAFVDYRGERRVCQIILQTSANTFMVALCNQSYKPGRVVDVHRRDLSEIDDPNILQILGLDPSSPFAKGGIQGGFSTDNRQLATDNRQ